MPWRRDTVAPVLAAVALFVAMISLVAPWWIHEEAGDEAVATPLGAAEMAPERISEAGLVGAGVIVLAGIFALAGSLGVEVWSFRRDRQPPLVAAWMNIAGGSLLLVGGLVAVIVWPVEPFTFWSSVGGVEARAGLGWFLCLIAGGIGSVGGLLNGALLMRASRGEGLSFEAR